MKCPKCNRSNVLVAASAWFETSLDGAECVGDIEWDDDTAALCAARLRCGWAGKVRECLPDEDVIAADAVFDDGRTALAD